MKMGFLNSNSNCLANFPATPLLFFVEVFPLLLHVLVFTFGVVGSTNTSTNGNSRMEFDKPVQKEFQKL